jgi:hypothetical protein
MTEQAEVKGIGRFCDSTCPLCTGARGWAKFLIPVLMLEYYIIGTLMRLLHIPWPCVSREKQTGKKPWQK